MARRIGTLIWGLVIWAVIGSVLFHPKWVKSASEGLDIIPSLSPENTSMLNNELRKLENRIKTLEGIHGL